MALGVVPLLPQLPAPGSLPVSHLCHVLRVLRCLAEDLLEVALEAGKEVASLGVHVHARPGLHLLLERSAHWAALDEAQAGSR